MEFITSDKTGKGNTGALFRFMYVVLFGVSWTAEIFRNETFNPSEGILWLGVALFALLSAEYIAPHLKGSVTKIEGVKITPNGDLHARGDVVANSTLVKEDEK
jgi:ABC-type transport system involved in cytochrome c biogenesis permease component